MLVGYALNHDAGVYRMWNPTTDRVIVSCGIIWLRRMYFEQQQGPPNVIVGPTFTNEVWEGVGNDDTVEPSIDENVGNNETSNDEEKETESLDIERNDDSEDETCGDQEDSDDESFDDQEDSMVEDDNNITTGSDNGNITTTRSGRTVKPPSRLIEELGNSFLYNEIANVTNAERNYLAQIIAMQ